METIPSTICLFICAILGMTVPVSSQTTVPLSNRGLYLVHFLNASKDATPDVRQTQYISAFSDDTPTRTYIPAAGVDQVFDLDGSNDHTYEATYSQDLGVPRDQHISQRAGLVVSQDGAPLFVHANRNEQGTSAAYMAFPLTTHSNEFFVPSYTTTLGHHTAFAVASLEDGTCMEVYYVKGDNYHRKGLYHLDAFDVFTDLNNTELSDYTGVFINSTRPISVWGGAGCAKIPINKDFCDAIVSQVPPVVEWGTEFIIGQIDGRSRVNAGYEFRVIASENDTLVTYKSSDDTLKTRTIQRGEFVSASTMRTTSTVYVTTSAKCLVVQYNRGRDAVGGEQVNTDPYMVIITPLDHYTTDVRLTTMEYFHSGSLVPAEDYITVVCRASGANGMRLSGVQLTGWAAVDGRTDYVTTSKPLVTKGYYTLTNTDPSENFTAWVYGHGVANTDKIGYGYVAAYAIKDDALNIAGIYDISQTTTVPPTTTPGAWVTGTWSDDITPADLPQFGIKFTGVFRTITRHDNIIETSCAEGYEAFFKTKRLPEMATHMSSIVGDLCPGLTGSVVTMTSRSQDLFYWEYTQGVFGFVLVLVGSPTSTFREIAACADILKVYVRELDNWPTVSVFVGKGPQKDLPRTDLTNFLSKDGDMETCNDVIVRMTEGFAFADEAKGWICNGLDPEEILTTVGGSTRPVSTSALLLTGLLLCWKVMWA